MTTNNPNRSTADPVSGEPLYPLLVPLPFVCFAGAFVTDLFYWHTAAVMWETFSIWLITAGLVMAGFASTAFVIDLVRGKGMPTLAWPFAVCSALAVLLSLVNAFVHSRDGYTAVVPTGLMLSCLVIIFLITGWVGPAFVSRDSIRKAL